MKLWYKFLLPPYSFCWFISGESLLVYYWAGIGLVWNDTKCRDFFALSGIGRWVAMFKRYMLKYKARVYFVAISLSEIRYFATKIHVYMWVYVYSIGILWNCLHLKYSCYVPSLLWPDCRLVFLFFLYFVFLDPEKNINTTSLAFWHLIASWCLIHSNPHFHISMYELSQTTNSIYRS